MYLRSPLTVLGTIPLVIGLLAACASPNMAADQKDDPLASPKVGKEIKKVCFTRGISGFRSWEGNNGLILRKGVKDYYLTTFVGHCANARSAERVGFDDDGNGCLDRGDTLIVSDRMFPGQNSSVFELERCRVNKIYIWHPDAGEEDSQGEDEGENNDTDAAG